MSYSGKFKDKDNNLHPVTSVLYGTCDTAAATAAKVVTCADFDRLMTGVTIRVKFIYGNTAASPTVNINSTGATAVYCYGSTAPVGGTSWQAGAVVELVYDGTSFFIVGSATSGSDDIVAAEFSTATTYAAGDYCIYDGGLYKFKTSHTGAWAAADVDSITVTGELKGKQDIFERISYADWQLLTPQQQAAKPYYIYDYPSTAITAANVSYDHTQSGLSATTAQGGIDELASEKQDKTDSSLTTTSNTIVGAINEVKSGLTNLSGLMNYGIYISNTTSDGRYYTFTVSKTNMIYSRVPIIVFRCSQLTTPVMVTGNVTRADATHIASMLFSDASVTYDSSTNMITIDAGANAHSPQLIFYPKEQIRFQ